MARRQEMSRLVWSTVTGPMAWCGVEACEWRGYHGDSDQGARKAIAAARRHASETGHEVIVERGQSMRVKP